MRLLASLAAKRRLIADSRRSPACAATESRAPAVASRIAEPCATAKENSAPATELAARAPMTPAQVLLGDTLGHSFGQPSNRPARKPAVSETITIKIRNVMAVRPRSESERSQMRATAGSPA